MLERNGRRSRPTTRSHARRSARPLVVLALLLGASAPADAQSLQTVLLRASQYISRYQQVFSAVVMEESYHQEIRRGDETRQTRDLRSDILMVWVPRDEHWTLFRDVYEVNDREVRDRQKRLERLFLESPDTAADQAKKIADESARFNLGSVRRNFNLPTMALVFLYPSNAARISYEKLGEEIVEDVPVWCIGFTELARPTIVRTNTGDIFSRGRFWIDSTSGRVVRSELVVGDANTPVRATVTVTYRPDERLDFWVPGEMVEVYDRAQGPREDVIHGRAVYTNFRRFEVQVEESIEPPSP